MRVPTRKAGKYAHLRPDPNLTREKYEELKANLERLKAKQPAAIAEVKKLASDGDFSENAAYQIAKGRLRGINHRMSEIEKQLKNAVIINTSAAKDRIGLGSRILVEVNGKEKEYTILGSAETDPLRGIISHNSPIGSTLMRRKVGDEINIDINGREINYKIISIT